MVSQRCKMAIKEELNKLGLHFANLELGSVEVMEELTMNQREELKTALLTIGLELMTDKKAMLIEKIKTTIIEMVHFSDELPKTNFSDFLSQKLDFDYTYLSNLFSEVQGITIERFIIEHKIERVKELIIYGELSLSEIAWNMHYSSAAHLSNQFKKITGFTPNYYRKLKNKRRSPIEDIGTSDSENISEIIP